MHSAWIIVEADSSEEARYVVPPSMRAEAKVVGLSKFTMEEIDAIIAQHEG